MKTALYLRVSTEDQAAEGYSIDAQKSKLVQYCQIHDLDIVGIYVDEGISGKSLDRPQVQQLIKDVKEGKIENVLVFKLDRITRSLKDLIELVDLFDKYGVHFNSLNEKIDTSTPNGRMFLQLMGVLAEWERGVIAERVVVGMEQRAKEGIYTCAGEPFGFKRVGDGYVPKESEAKVVRLIFDMYLKGKGYRKISEHLDNLGIKTKRGKTWLSRSVSRIIKSPYFAGYFYYKNNKDELIKATNIEPIISFAIWEKAKKIAESRTVDSAKKYSRDEFVFHNVLRCSCGKRFNTNISISTRNGKKNYHFYYQCINFRERRCNQRYISIQKANTMFVEFLKKLQNEKITYDVEYTNKRIHELEERKSGLEQELEKENTRKKRLQYLYIDEKIDNASYLDLMSEISNTTDKLIKDIKQIEEEVKRLSGLDESEKKKTYVTKVLKMWDKLDTKGKKEFIRTFFKSIIVKDSKIVEVEFI